MDARPHSGSPAWFTVARLVRAFVLLAFLGTIASAHSHRGHAVWTEITWTGDRFEITHRLHVADAITANRFMGGREAIDAPRSLARVALYVEDRFQLLGPEGPAGADLPSLETIGAEIEDDFLFVYQEWVTPLPERFPALDHSVLLDVEPDAQAFVNITGPGISEERELR